MKLFVTGATGFTGGHLARELVRQGHEVHAMVRKGSDVSELKDPGITLFEGSLTSHKDLEKAMAGCEKAYHIAAVFRTANHPDSYYHDINVGGTVAILETAQKLGLERVIHCSTGGVHGHIADPPCTETSPLKPGDIYQVSKLEGEQAVMAAAQKGQRVSVFRPASIYGPGDLRLLKLFKTIHTRKFRMIGPGTAHFHTVYIDDLVDGIIRCGTRDEALGEIFLLAGPKSVPLTELVQNVSDAVGTPLLKGHIPVGPVLFAARICEAICVPLKIDPPIYPRRVGFFTKHREFDCSKARNLLGYDPKITTAEGVKRTAQWYFEQGHLTGKGPG